MKSAKARPRIIAPESPFKETDPLDHPRAREYWTGEVHYFWRPMAELVDFHGLYKLDVACLNPEWDYVVFMFHEDSLFRISYRLYGPPTKECRDRISDFLNLPSDLI